MRTAHRDPKPALKSCRPEDERAGTRRHIVLTLRPRHRPLLEESGQDFASPDLAFIARFFPDQVRQRQEIMEQRHHHIDDLQKTITETRQRIQESLDLLEATRDVAAKGPL
jgi:hypothetical protein